MKDVAVGGVEGFANILVGDGITGTLENQGDFLCRWQNGIQE